MKKGIVKRIKVDCKLVDFLPQWGIKLTPSGNILRANCPFHDDRTPSFTVYPQENRYHCYGCGTRGDVIDFFMRYHGADFQQTITSLKETIPEKFSTSQGVETINEDPPCNFNHNSSEWPQELKSWLEGRGITEDTAARFDLAHAHYANRWEALAVPVGDPDVDGYWKLRFYQDDFTSKFITWPKGRRQRLYMPRRPEPGEVVLLTEGELDAITAAQEGFAAVGVPTGAKSFKTEWADELAGLDVVIIFDNDQAGQEGAQKAAAAIHGKASSIWIVELPESLGEGGDLTDFLISGAKVDDLLKLMETATPFSLDAEISDKSQAGRVVLPADPPATIEEVEAVVTEAFGEAAWFVTRCTLAVAATLLLEDIVNPTGLNLVGPPSSLKTTILGFYYDLQGIVYHTDNFSPASFVTLSKGKEEQLREIDLLPKMQHRVFVVPELAPIFQRRREDIIDSIAILTRVFDGEGLQRDGGTGSRGYKGDYVFAWLGGTTPFPNKVWNMMGKLGSRFLFLTMPETACGDEKVQRITQNLLRKKTYRILRLECRGVVHRFLRGLWISTGGVRGVRWEVEMTDEAIIELIGRIARFVCVARATITGRMKRDFYRGDEFIFNQPMIEEPDRLATILFNLARGHALIHGRNCLTWEDLSPVIEIALSSMPDDRRQVIQHMVSSKGGFTDAKKLEEALGVSRPTALDIMRLLDAIGLVSFAEGSGSKLSYTTLKDEFHWILTEEFRALRVPYFMKGQNAQHRGK